MSRPPQRYLLSAAQWLVGAWLLARVRHPRPATPSARFPDPHTRLRVSVLIPARNEAGSLPHLLASLAAQSVPAAETIVVDDASEDETGELARAFGVTVLESAGPPAGWSGKCWALHQAQAVATGDVLVFLDADVTLAPDGLARIVGELTPMGGKGLVSVEPYHRTERRYEQLSGLCNVVALMGTGAFTGPPGREPPMAFGPCIAIDRETYDLVGGHAHPDVRSRGTEDLALARRAKSYRRPVAIFAGGDVVAFRMYPEGLCHLLNGWTRVLATGARGGPPVIAAAAGFWVTGALVASGSGGRVLAGISDLALRRRGRRDSRGRALRAASADAALYGAWAAQIGWMLRRVGQFGPATAVAFPLPLAVFVYCFVRSAVKTGLGRPQAWRGRVLTGR